jgi:hypothetical protein
VMVSWMVNVRHTMLPNLKYYWNVTIGTGLSQTSRSLGQIVKITRNDATGQ